MKKTASLLITLVVVCVMCIPNLAAYGNGYNAQAALDYAKNHWNDGVGLCAQFVSECLKAGGVSAYSKSGTELRRQLKASNLGTEYTISLNSDKSISMSAYTGKIAAGDPVFFYCSSCDSRGARPYIHTVLCNGADGNGYMKAYSHNNANSGASKYKYSSTCYQCGAKMTQAKVYHMASTASAPPVNVYLSLNQVWYDIQDTIELTPHADGATNFVMSIRRQETWEEMLFTELNGTYSIPSSRLGYGDYYAWITATNSAGGTDSKGITFSVVGSPGYSDVWTDKKTFSLSETVYISVATICAKGQVIGLNKEGVGRIITQDCGSTFAVPASELGIGSYHAYFSVYNGSGGIDTKGINFDVVDPIGYGDDFYAFIINMDAWKHLTNEGNNVSLRAEIPSDSQKWRFLRQGDGSYKIVSLKDGKCLDVESASAESGANVQVWDDNGSTAQRWYIVKEDGNQYLVSQCSRCRLDVAGGSKEDGTNIQMFDKNKSVAQQFSIYGLTGKPPQYARLSTDKEIYEKGETVNFYSRSDYATSFNISVFRDTKTAYGEHIMKAVKIPSEYSISFDVTGEYSAYISASNDIGSLDSKWIHFSVVDSLPTPIPMPTPTPTATSESTPTTEPTAVPAEKPTAAPTAKPLPSAAPTQTPTAMPTQAPNPTMKPTSAPTAKPTAEPTAVPTAAATETPTPTATPTVAPTATPKPMTTPTANPTVAPEPTATPTVTPPVTPIPMPTIEPASTLTPTAAPTDEPEYSWRINDYQNGVVTFTAPESDSVCLYIAKYKCDMLADCEIIKVACQIGKNSVNTFKNLVSENGETVKIMLWSDSLTPLAESLSR